MEKKLLRLSVALHTDQWPRSAQRRHSHEALYSGTRGEPKHFAFILQDLWSLSNSVECHLAPQRVPSEESVLSVDSWGAPQASELLLRQAVSLFVAFLRDVCFELRF